jgi:O-antigen/teichoic acid export membrane protein
MGWLFFDKILRMGVGVLVGVWVARHLGAEQFGLYSYAVAFVGLFGAIAGLGLQSIVIRDIIRDPTCRDETLGTAAVLQMVGGFLSYGCILGAIYWLRTDDTMAKLLVAILGSVVLLKASEVAAYWFESQVMSKYTVWVQNGIFLIFSSVKVALIFNQATVASFAWAAMAEALAAAIFMLVLLSFRGSKIRDLRASLARTKSLLSASWPLLLSGMTIMIYMKIDQIMLGQMLGDEAVGIFSAATRISEIWYFVPMAVVASVFPAILEAKKQSEELYYARLQRLYDLMVFLAVAVALPMTFLATPIVIMLFGEAYRAAGSVLAIHIWAAVFVFLGVASGQWLLAENRQSLSLQRSAIGMLINVSLNYVLIPNFGPMGAASATVFSQAVAAWLFDIANPATKKMFYMKLAAMNPLKLARKKNYD